MELFQKKYPELNVYKNYDDPLIPLNTSNFFFAIVFTDKNGTIVNIDDKVIFVQRKKIVNSNHIINESTDFRDQEVKDDPLINISFVKCKHEFLAEFENADDAIKNYIVRNGHCFEMNNTIFKGSPMFTTNSTGFRYIFGYDTEKYYDFASFNDTFPFRIQFFYQSVLYNPNNYTNPIKKELGMLQSISDAYHFYHYRSYFSLTTSERDDNIFFSDVKLTKNFGLTQFQYGFLSYDPVDYHYQYLMQLDIFLEHYHEVYSRKYKKIQEVMAEISGFGSIALVVVNIIFTIVKNEIVTATISIDYYGPLLSVRENSDLIKLQRGSKQVNSIINENNTVDYLNRDSAVNYKIINIAQKNTKKGIFKKSQNSDKMLVYKKEQNLKLLTHFAACGYPLSNNRE